MNKVYANSVIYAGFLKFKSSYRRFERVVEFRFRSYNVLKKKVLDRVFDGDLVSSSAFVKYYNFYKNARNDYFSTSRVLSFFAEASLAGRNAVTLDIRGSRFLNFIEKFAYFKLEKNFLVVCLIALFINILLSVLFYGGISSIGFITRSYILIFLGILMLNRSSLRNLLNSSFLVSKLKSLMDKK